MGNGQRSLYVIYRGRGIVRRTKVGVGLWGGSPRAGFTTEPADAEVIAGAFRWPVAEKKTLIQPYGYSFAKGPFGPQDINGRLAGEGHRRQEGRRARQRHGRLLSAADGQPAARPGVGHDERPRARGADDA